MKPELLKLEDKQTYKFKSEYGEVNIYCYNGETTVQRALWLLEAAKIDLIFGG